MDVLIEVAALSGIVFVFLCVLHRTRRHERFCREYANIVAKYGPDDARAKAYRESRSKHPAFLRFADRYDKVKRAVGGSGIDYPPEE